MRHPSWGKARFDPDEILVMARFLDVPMVTRTKLEQLLEILAKLQAGVTIDEAPQDAG